MPYFVYCADCGMERHVRYKNTRYCATCRTLRDGAYWHKSAALRACRDCKAHFLPLRGTEKLCANCVFVAPHARKTCAMCHTPDAHVVSGHDLCYSCAQDPSKRGTILKALAAKQATQRAEYASNIGRLGERRGPAKSKPPTPVQSEPTMEVIL